MKDFLILVNYKTYEQSMGRRALGITRDIEKASREHEDVTVAVAPCAADIRLLSEKTELDIYAQHVDPVGFGGFTGCVHPSSVSDAGAKGVLINHSEDRRTLADISALVKMCREAQLATVVCTDNIDTTGSAAALCPDFVAIEPPELIGGDISVSTARPELVSNAAAKVGAISPSVRLLCGAGVKNGEDVKKAAELGAKGILLASGITKASNPYAAMLELVSAAAEIL